MTHTKLHFLAVAAFIGLAPAANAQEQAGCGCGHGAKAMSAGTTPSAFAEGALLDGVRTFDLTVTDDGFVPARLKVKQGETVRLVVTRTTDSTCAKEIVIKDRGINAPLPLQQAVTVEFKAGRSGEIRYACGMDHVSGVVLVK